MRQFWLISSQFWSSNFYHFCRTTHHWIWVNLPKFGIFCVGLAGTPPWPGVVPKFWLPQSPSSQ